MYYYVYLLKSIQNPDAVYVGYTANLKQRFEEHNLGKSPRTTKYRPWRLEVCCAFQEKAKAISFEKYLKSGSGRAFLSKFFR